MKISNLHSHVDQLRRSFEWITSYMLNDAFHSNSDRELTGPEIATLFARVNGLKRDASEMLDEIYDEVDAPVRQYCRRD